MNIHRRVKERAKAKGKTMKQLAEVCGMTPQNLHRLLTGRSSLDVETLRKIAAELEVTVGYLLGEVDEVFLSQLLEVQLYDLEKGILKMSGTELIPRVTLKSMVGCVVREDNTLFVIDLVAKPRSGERGLVEIDGYYLDKRRQLMDSWAAFCRGGVVGERVTPIGWAL